MAPSSSPHTGSLIRLHLAVLLAGATGLFGKWLSLSPAAITCGRTFFGSVAVGLYAWQRGENLRVRTRKDLGMLALSGALLALHWMTFFRSIQVSTVAICLLALASYPVLVTFLEPLFFSERLRRADVFIAGVVTLGLILVTPHFDLGNHLTQGLLWGVLSALACAFLTLLSRTYSRRYPAAAVTFYQQVFAALLTLPMAWFSLTEMSGHDLGLLVVLGTLFTALLQGLIVAGLQHLSAQTVSVVLGLEPVYGIAFAWVLIREIPSMRTLFGGALILGAVLWVSFAHRRAWTELEALAPL